jgi:glucose-6-phosphate 1-dehydrogenase
MSLNTFTIYLFGGTGDLSKRKLLPAIFRQETLSSIDHESQIIGIGSKDMQLDEYISLVKESLSNHFNGFDPSGEAWTRFSMRLGYKKLDINSDSDWEKFGEIPQDRPIIYYLATPPNLYKVISKSLKFGNLINNNSRIVVEKPIGSDLKTANEINNSLADGFLENQIYRIGPMQLLIIFR